MHAPHLNRRHWLAAAGAASLMPSAWAQNYPFYIQHINQLLKLN